MVQVDVPMAFGIGCLFAEAAKKQLQTKRPEYFYRTMAFNNIYQIFFFSWVPVYFLLNYFGWETSHMWWHGDTVNDYPYYVPIFMVIFFLAANIGFLLGNMLVSNNKVIANRILYIGAWLFSTIWIFGQYYRTFFLGTYSEWKAGTAPWFFQDPVFLFMLIFSLVVWGAGLLFFFLKLINEDKKL